MADIKRQILDAINEAYEQGKKYATHPCIITISPELGAFLGLKDELVRYTQFNFTHPVGASVSEIKTQFEAEASKPQSRQNWQPVELVPDQPRTITPDHLMAELICVGAQLGGGSELIMTDPGLKILTSKLNAFFGGK